MLKDFSKSKFDIIIAAGQSNCAGKGKGDIEKPYQIKNNVWELTKSFYIRELEEKVDNGKATSSFYHFFVEEYLENGNLEEGRELLVITSAVGGTGFGDKNWGKNEPLSTDMLEMTKTALELNPENKVVAFLWHQGETDVQLEAPPKEYEEKLRILLTDVRENFGRDYPMIAGDYVMEWKNKQGQKSIDIADVNKRLFEEFDGYFVSSEGLTSNQAEVPWAKGDIIHFSKKAVVEFGKRYYKMFEEYKNK